MLMSYAVSRAFLTPKPAPAAIAPPAAALAAAMAAGMRNRGKNPPLCARLRRLR